jgi:hypothetical protein
MNKKLIFSVLLVIYLMAVVAFAGAQSYPQTYMNYTVTLLSGNNKGRSVTVVADNPGDAEAQGRRAMDLGSSGRVSAVLDTSGPKHDPSENPYANYTVTLESGNNRGRSVTVTASSPSDAEAQGRRAMGLGSSGRVSVRL